MIFSLIFPSYDFDIFISSHFFESGKMYATYRSHVHMPVYNTEHATYLTLDQLGQAARYCLGELKEHSQMQ